MFAHTTRAHVYSGNTFITQDDFQNILIFQVTKTESNFFDSKFFPNTYVDT